MGFTLDAIAGILKPLKDLASEFIVDKDARAELNAVLAQAQIGLQSEFVDLEKTLASARSDIIVAEAKSQSWIARNWRPLTMLTFVGLIVAKWFGFTVDGIAESVEIELMNLVQIGLGGYIIGRSAEKIVPQVAEILGKRR